MIPRFRYGDIFERIGKDSLVLFTANSTVTKDGRLVMGRGAAKQFKERYPDLDRDLGAKLLTEDAAGSTFGVLVSDVIDQDTEIGAFQVKVYWAEPASEYLISLSVKELKRIAGRYESISLNYPGIGNGRLLKENVAPLLMGLPKHVTIWYL